MLSIILWSLAISLVINTAMFIVAFKCKSDKLTDVSYAITFIALVLFTLHNAARIGAYNFILAGMICLWAIRLGGFLLYRVIKNGKDRRFDGLRERFWQFGRFWLGQAFTIWVLMLPSTFAFNHEGDLGLLGIIGLGGWLIGFVVESIADYQKYRFNGDVKNRNHWIDEGVWKYSRHPNYFGEILVWIGVYLYSLPALRGFEICIGLLSPLLIIVLLVFISGMPILEKSADKRWNKLSAYREYKARTNKLIPLSIKRRKRITIS